MGQEKGKVSNEKVSNESQRSIILSINHDGYEHTVVITKKEVTKRVKR